MNYQLVILGSGESGVGAALLAQAKNITVFVSDSGMLKEVYKNELHAAGIPFEEGKHTEEIVLAATEIIKSPGIPETVEIIRKAKAQSIPIISEIEFAYRYKGNSKIVAITGSNGKTTSTNLTYHIFKEAGLSVSMCGNVGYSFARQLVVAPTAWYIIEISSFQLDDIKTFKPNIAVLLNITPDHLDRYNYKFENYIESKFKIAMNLTQDDCFVICADDEAINNHLHTLKSNPEIITFSMDKKSTKNSAYLQNENLVIDINGELTSMPSDELSLKGKHNAYNSMASGISARKAEVRSEKLRECLGNFKTLEHRLEKVLSIRGVEFINDSKATNINSVWYALESMSKPTILILGGVDKGNDYTIIEELVAQKVKAIVCLGLDNTLIHNAFATCGIQIINTKSASDAVQKAYEISEPGDAVLLSPACASFDLFKNYEDRGNQFKEAVKHL
jgi:UDP-N-acetylmuramoylalanine--D-glutamate ligase